MSFYKVADMEKVGEETVRLLKLAMSSGISTSSLHGYLNRTLPTSLQILIKLSDSLVIGLDELIFGEKAIVQKLDGLSLWEITGIYELTISKKY